MVKGFLDLIEDLFKYIAGVLSDIFGMLGDIRKNPFWARVSDDLGASFGSLMSSCGEFSSKTFDAARGKLRGNDLLSQVVLWSFVALISFTLIVTTIVFEVGNRWDRNVYTINVVNGFGASEVADLLLERGIIDNRYSFDILMGIMGLENHLQAGVYKFSPNMGLGSIVMKLKAGDVISPPLAKIIFPEGTSIYKMGAILKDSGISGGAAFERFAESPASEDLKDKFPFLKMIKIDSLEGFLFPDTYLVPEGVTDVTLRDLMLSRFGSVALPVLLESSKHSSMSPYEILILASIIEKEAAVDEERPVISSVFHNRLRKRMYLSADPTIKYALSQFRRPTKRVYYEDLEINSPYNTYKHLGLPPGPICNPGVASIKAAIFPADTEYLYFVARGDGTHIFSKTWEDHERAKILARGR